MKEIQIFPLSTVFFRDGRPFTMEADSFASSIFPPSPVSYRGFIRSVYISHELNADKSKIDSSDDSSKDLNIVSTGLLIKDDATSKINKLFPVPLDLYPTPSSEVAGENPIGLKTLVLKDAPISSHSLPLVLKCLDIGKMKSVEGKAFLTEDDFTKYLNGLSLTDVKPIWISDFISQEVKTGIARNYATRNKIDGRLYSIQMKRVQNTAGKSLGFFAQYEGLDDFAHTSGINRIGGEGKLADYKISSQTFENFTGAQSDQNGVVKMYLATPGLFKDGWQPSFLKNYNIEIIATTIGRYHNIGGWDMKINKAKPMFRVVPAGSVYYLKGPFDKISELIQKINGKNLPNEIPYYNQDGFGQVYFANISEKI